MMTAHIRESSLFLQPEENFSHTEPILSITDNGSRTMEHVGTNMVHMVPIIQAHISPLTLSFHSRVEVAKSSQHYCRAADSSHRSSSLVSLLKGPPRH